MIKLTNTITGEKINFGYNIEKLYSYLRNNVEQKEIKTYVGGIVFSKFRIKSKYGKKYNSYRNTWE